MTAANTKSDSEVVISRTFNAPREFVFAAWSDPAHFVHWWGPFPTTNPECEIDFRAGGAFRWVMRSPDGVDYPLTGVYREIIKPERIVYTQSLNDNPPAWRDKLNALRHAPAGSLVPDGTVTVTFEDVQSKTLLTITSGFDSALTAQAFRDMQMVQGWGMSLDRLEHVVAPR